MSSELPDSVGKPGANPRGSGSKGAGMKDVVEEGEGFLSTDVVVPLVTLVMLVTGTVTLVDEDVVEKLDVGVVVLVVLVVEDVVEKKPVVGMVVLLVLVVEDVVEKKPVVDIVLLEVLFVGVGVVVGTVLLAGGYLQLLNGKPTVLVQICVKVGGLTHIGAQVVIGVKSSNRVSLR